MKVRRRLVPAGRRRSSDVGEVVVVVDWRAREDEIGDLGARDEEGETMVGDELDGELSCDTTEAELQQRGDKWSIKVERGRPEADEEQAGGGAVVGSGRDPRAEG